MIKLLSKTLLSTLRVCLFFVLLIGCCGYLVLATEAGFRHSLRTLNKIALPQLSIETIEGTWLTQAKLSNVHYRNKDQQVHISEITSGIKLSKLLHYTLHFEQLHIGNLNIQNTQTQKQTSPATKSGLPSLPARPNVRLNLLWDDLQINSITVDDSVIKDIHSGGLVYSNSRKLQLALNQFTANINGAPLKATGKLSLQQNSLKAEQIKLEYLNNIFKLDGSLKKQLNWVLNWQQPKGKQFLNAEGEIHGAGKNVHVKAKIRADLDQFGVQLKNFSADIALENSQHNLLNINADRLRYQEHVINNLSLQSQGTLGQQRYQLKLIPDNLPALAIDGHWSLNLAKLFDNKLRAEIDFHSDSVAGLAALIPQVERLAGKIEGKLQVKGSLDAPAITGHATLTEAKFDLPSLGLSINPATIELHKPDAATQDVQISGKLTSGQGTLTLNGQTSLDFQQANTLINLSGSNVLIANTKEFKIVADPELVVSQDRSKNLKISGDVTIPSAELHPEAIAGQENLSEDFVFKKSKQDKQQQKESDVALPLHLDITLIAGKAITITYNEFASGLKGKLNLKKQPNQPMTGQGELIIVDGAYKAHGQDLKINNGRLLYINDTIGDPHLDVMATRSVTINSSESNIPIAGLFENNPVSQFGRQQRNIEVGLHVTGKASKPKYKLFSKPANLSQGEILSYLILGRALSDATNDSAGLLMQAASAMKLKGKDVAGITDQLQSWFGLDKIGVKSVETKDQATDSYTPKTAVNLGKKLSPRLYLDYTVGLFDPVNILKLRYQLKDRWVIETETDKDNSGIDLFYHFESD